MKMGGGVREQGRWRRERQCKAVGGEEDRCKKRGGIDGELGGRRLGMKDEWKEAEKDRQEVKRRREEGSRQCGEPLCAAGTHPEARKQTHVCEQAVQGK